MTQKKLTEGFLLDEEGNLHESGYHTRLIKKYDRNHIKASKLRIKEWDYYYINNDEYAIALTIADNSYMSLVSVSFIDFKNVYYKTTSEIKFFSMGKIKLPASLENGHVTYKSKRCDFEFNNNGKERLLKVNFAKFIDKKSFSCEIKLENNPQEYMAIAIPFKKKRHFYYNAKVNCLTTSGYFIVGDQKYLFNKENTLATLDWGRGVWTYKNTWYWASLQTYIDSKRVGFNIGYGFGNTSNASENMIFYDGKSCKLEKVIFNIPKNNKNKDDYLQKWNFTSSDGRFEMEFEPIIDRKDETNLLILASIQHQVFGYFTGYMVLDDGQKIILNKKLGFAEKVFNKW